MGPQRWVGEAGSQSLELWRRPLKKPWSFLLPALRHVSCLKLSHLDRRGLGFTFRFNSFLLPFAMYECGPENVFKKFLLLFYVSPILPVFLWDACLLCSFINFRIGAISAFPGRWCLTFKDLLPCLVFGVGVNLMIWLLRSSEELLDGVLVFVWLANLIFSHLCLKIVQ